MDPKFLIDIGQTNPKTAPKNAVDGSGDSAMQSGKGFKEAFKAASGAEAKALGSQGNAVTDAPQPSSGSGEAVKQTGKPLPQKSDTGKHHPANNLQPSLPAHEFSGGDIEIEEVGTHPDTRNHFSAGSTGSGDGDQVLMSKGDHPLKQASEASTTRSVDPLSLGRIKVVLPNGAATRDELVEFAQVQKLPAEFVAQLQDYDGDDAPLIFRNDGLQDSSRGLALSSGIRRPSSDESLISVQQLRDEAVSLRDNKNLAATNDLPPLAVADIDQRSKRSQRPITMSATESAIKLGAGDKAELSLSVQKVLTSTEFIGDLMRRLEISPEYQATDATQSEPTHSNVAELIAQKLSKATGSTAIPETPLIAKTEEALIIRDSIVETFVSGALTNLSDDDLDSISNLLAPLFSSIEGDQKLKLSDPDIDLRPQTGELGSIRLALSSNQWSLNRDGMLGQKLSDLYGDQRPVTTVAAGSMTQISSTEKFDTSLIMAKPVDGGAHRGLSLDELPQPVTVVPSRTEKSLTSSELLDLRNVGTVKSEVMSVRVSSSNDLGGLIPSSPETVSITSSSFTDKPIQSAFDQTAPITAETSVQTQNSSSRSSANDAMRAMQHQPSHQLESDKLNLSARLTQALGERLVQNIRNGNYNIRFNIHPKELGVVDIAMEVRDGRLEAQISSPSAVTRDLLSESLPRLRDSLQTGGLQLAGLEVSDNSNDGQQRTLKGSSDNSMNSDDKEDLVETFVVDNLIIDDEAVDYLA